MAGLSAGQEFTCTEGHYVGRAAKNLDEFQVINPDLFDDLQGPAIKMRDHFGLCVCGAWWARFGSFHTPDGWLSKFAASRVDGENDCVPPHSMPKIIRHGPRG